VFVQVIFKLYMVDVQFEVKYVKFK